VHGAPQFAPLDIAFAEVLASATVAAIEVGEVRSELERYGIVAEDERIARDLHDTVIQEIFALGMLLEATRSSVSGLASDRIDIAVSRLDGVIRDVRNTIFRLPGRTENVQGLRDAMSRSG
jgi:signal transduction histidine kinase